MLKFYQTDVVYKLVNDYSKEMQNDGKNNYEIILSVMSLLCKVMNSFTTTEGVEEDVDSIINSTYFKKIRRACDIHYKEILPICAEKLLKKYFSEISWGQSIQSSELTELVLTLLKENHIRTVYNPFAGLASYGMADFIHDYHGEECDSFVCQLAKMRLELNGFDSSGIVCDDSIRNWNTHGVDCIVSTPPFGMRIKELHAYLPFSSKTTEQYVLERFIPSRTKHAYYIMPSSVCSDSNTFMSNLRQQIVDNNMIEMVVLLPSGVYSKSGISLSLIVLNKKRDVNEPALFVDASDNYKYKANSKEKILDVEGVLQLIHSRKNDKCVEVRIDEIVKKRYTWNVLAYLVDKGEQIPQGYSVKTLRELLEPISKNKYFLEKKGRLVDISSLSSEDFKYLTNPDNFKESDVPDRATKVEEPVLLLSSIGKLKPTYCLASPEEPIFLHPHVYGYKLAFNGLDPEYLCWELSKKKMPFVGASIPHIRREDLLDTKISFPPINEQVNIFNEAAKVSKLAKAKELGLQEIIDKMKAEYINEVRTRKHDMRPYIRELGSIERLSRNYIAKKNNMPDFSEKMISLMDKFHVALTNLSDMIEIFSEEQQFGESEKFDINEYFAELEAKHDLATGYQIDYSRDDDALMEYGIPVVVGVYDNNFSPIDPENDKELWLETNKFPVIVDFNHLDFERLTRNIIENAVTHGFTDPNRSDYRVKIDLTIDMEKKMFQIDFSNNGNPLPSGMNKRRYGILGEKAGMTGRTGSGGYIVKSIVEHYHGDYDIYTDGERTVVRILLPIANYEYDV